MINLLILPLIVFTMAADYGSIGLYQHDYEPFYDIREGDILRYHNDYEVTYLWMFYAVDEDNEYSDFIGYGKYLSVEEMFMMTYGVPDRLVLQTCVGDHWRLFIIAEPVGKRMPQ